MQYGFTSGSCAAAAAKAAVYMLLSGRRKTEITIETPKGISYHATVEHIKIQETEVSCAVQKDGGDDPDVTTGAWIYAAVSICEENNNQIEIDGGIGVGRVTRPGLDQPVGNAAINTVPRQMIAKEVSEVCHLFDFQGGIKVVISVPEGENLAAQTFNPRLGIKGGISILGTSGIVEPMSDKALLDTIAVELKQKRAEGHSIVAISPGNYGLEFMKRTYGYDLERSVKCSNFIGQTIDMVKELGFSKMLLTGHIGKLIKVSGGIMNTHSHTADCRTELFCTHAALCGASREVCAALMNAATTDACLELLDSAGLRAPVLESLLRAVQLHLDRRACGAFRVGAVLFSNQHGPLGATDTAAQLLNEWKEH